MRKISLFLPLVSLLILLTSKTFSQNLPQVDSLKQQGIELKDTALISNKLEIANHFLAYGLADSANIYIEQALATVDKSRYPLLFAEVLNAQGTQATYQGKYANASGYFLKALTIYKDSDELKGISKVSNNMGRLYFRMQDYQRAHEAFMHSLKTDEKLGDARGVGVSYHNLGIIYTTTDSNLKAIGVRQKALEIPEIQRDTLTMAPIYMGLGANYREIGRFDSADYYFQHALLFSRKLKHRELELRNLLGLTRTAILAKAFHKAQNYLDQLYALEAEPPLSRKSYLHNYQAEVFLGNGQSSIAIEEAMKALALAEETDDWVLKNNAYFQLYEFYEKLNQPEKALHYHKLYQAVQDTLFEQEKMNQIEKLEFEYQMGRKEAEIQRLGQKAEIQRLQMQRQYLWFILAGLGIFIFAGIGILLYRQKILREQFLRLKTEQKLLRAQMNPHFLFHALSSIQHFILLENDPRKSVQYLSRYTRLMRNVLDSSRIDQISLDKELELLEDYMDLQKLRFDNKFEYIIKLDEALDQENCLIPSMLLQPIVENAIEHGFARKKHGGKLLLDFRRVNGSLDISIEDNGVGRSRKEEVKKQTGRVSHGLQMAQERIQLLVKHHQSQASMEISDLCDPEQQPIGTRVDFHLPFISLNP